MKFKKIVCMLLIISILSISIFPVSYATYIYDSGDTSYTFEWKEDAESYWTSSELAGEIMHTVSIKPITIGVEETGLYKISNSFAASGAEEYMICKKVGDEYQILPVATYGLEGNGTMSLGMYNSMEDKSVSVYLEEGVEYYVFMVGEDGKGLASSVTSESKYFSLNVEQIAVPEKATVYEIQDTSSQIYSNPGGVRDGYYYYASNNPMGYTGEQIFTSTVASSTTSISPDEVGEMPSGDISPEDEKGSFFERIVTWFLIFVGDAIRSAIGMAFGQNITIDDLLFNQYSNTKLSIFKSSRELKDEKQFEYNRNNYLESSGLLDSVDADGKLKEGIMTKMFVIFRNISIGVYFVMLLYMGIRILLSSTGNKREKYKSMIADWFIGIVILLFFPHIMKYTIMLNDAVVEYIRLIKEDNPGIFKETAMPTMGGTFSLAQLEVIKAANAGGAGGDVMELMKYHASMTGRIAYAFIYIMLIKELITFIYIYYKRLISVIFLIMVFPLVTISYAIDKIADGKSQAFTNWYKEFALNVFMQAFQAINYLIIMGVIFTLSGSTKPLNVILVIIAFEFISKGDELLRSMFSKMSGGGGNTAPKSLAEAAKTFATFKIIEDTKKNIKGIGKRMTHTQNTINNMKESYHNYVAVRDADDERKQKEAQEEAERQRNAAANFAEEQAIDDVDGNMQAALNESKTNSPEEEKIAMDRILAAKYDPKKHAAFEEAFSRLSEEQQEKLNKKLEANETVNQMLSGDKGIRGPLTEREKNYNADLYIKIKNGKDTEEYKSLYEFLASTDRKVKNSDGREVTLMEYLDEKASARQITAEESRTLSNAQKLFGGVAGVDVSESKITEQTVDGVKQFVTPEYERVKKVRHLPFEKVDVNMADVHRIQSVYGDRSGISDELKGRQLRAASVVARVKAYVDRGVPMSAKEGVEIAKEWQSLSNDSDAGVQRILGQLGDGEEARRRYASAHSMRVEDVDDSHIKLEADIGCNMQQFVSTAALSAFNDRQNLGETDEEVRDVLNDAGKMLVEMNSGCKIDDDGEIEEIEIEIDGSVKKLLQRSELDSFMAEYMNSDGTPKNLSGVDFSRYIRTKETQEQWRDRTVFNRRREAYRKEYRDARKVQSVDSARQQFHLDAARAGGAMLSSTIGTTAEIAFGVTTGALVTGASGDYNLTKTVAVMNEGANASRFVMRNMPVVGTYEATTSSTSVGARLDKASQQYVKSSKRNSDEYTKGYLANKQRDKNIARDNINKWQERIENK